MSGHSHGKSLFVQGAKQMDALADRSKTKQIKRQQKPTEYTGAATGFYRCHLVGKKQGTKG